MTLTLKLKIALRTLLPPGAYCSVSQTHLDFYHMFNLQKHQKSTVLSSFITNFTAEKICQHQSVTYDVIDKLPTPEPIKVRPGVMSERNL